MARRASKIDANQGAIVDALRAVGCTVQSLAEVGDGCPDLLVGMGKWNILLEVKDGRKVRSERELTPMQKRWHANWRGTAHLVESELQALDVIAYYRRIKTES